jgi:death-on-curing protein
LDWRATTPFVDGNKRVTLVVAETFLGLHRIELTASDEDCLGTMLAVADGTMSEPELAGECQRGRNSITL